MYGMFAGFFHGAALVGSAGLSAGEFAQQAAAWATAMTGGFGHNAPAMDARDYTTTGEQTIAFNKAALDTIVQASRDEGLAVDLVAPLQELLARQLADGHGAASFARVFEGIRAGR